MAPEVVTRNGYNYGVDFYTLGALLHELVIGLPPFYSKNSDEMMSNIVNKKLVLPKNISRPLSDLLHRLLHKDLH